MYKDSVAVTSFYSFLKIEDIFILQQKMLLAGKRKGVKGTIILAPEGFNGSISGSQEGVEYTLNQLVSLTQADDISIKTNYTNAHPFFRFKVKLKQEIVTLGAGPIDVNALKGKYIEPQDWDAFIGRNDVVTVDVRNDYEIQCGTFRGAIDPHTTTFRTFPAWVEANRDLFDGKKIAMCCTGGIRCEKSTAYMRKLGYEEVYHLHGGILQYLQDIDPAQTQSKWEGECFVFDDRMCVDGELAPRCQMQIPRQRIADFSKPAVGSLRHAQ